LSVFDTMGHHLSLRGLLLRLRRLAAPRRAERELEEELAFHVERETQKQIAAGLSPSDARTRRAPASDRCRWPPTNAVTFAARRSSTT